MKKMYKKLKFLILVMAALLFTASAMAQAPDAPDTLIVQAAGPNGFVLIWEPSGDSSFVVQVSTDSVTFVSVDTIAKTDSVAILDTLMPGTDYDLHVFELSAAGNGDTVANEATTLVPSMLVHLPLDSLVGDTAIYNALTDSLDKVTNGPVSIVDAESSGLGKAATKFTATELPPIQNWIRLYNTTQGIDEAFIGKTVSFWFKHDSPGDGATMISFGKRAGMTITIKDNMLHGFTKMRTTWSGAGSGATWWVDSTGTEFTSGAWNQLTYVFDHPVTKIYLNGSLVDESDGIGYWDLTKTMVPLPWPSKMGMNEPSSTNGQSAEIGALYEPCAAMVHYMGDTWDVGVHAPYAFNGLMADMKMYNFALSADSISALFADEAVNLEGLTVQAQGQEELVLRWSDLEGDTGYEISQSDDGVAYTILDTTDADAESFIVEGLTPETEYSFMVKPLGIGMAVTNNMISGETVAEELLVHLKLDSLQGDTAIVNAVDLTIDNVSNGPVSIVSAEESGLGIPAMKFTSTELPPIQNWIRLWNTTQEIKKAYTGKTISLWIKNESPDEDATMISFGKRAGMALTIKDGMLHGLTGMRTTMSGPGSGATWWVDSTGAEFTSGDWAMLTWVFDNPVTKLYINGVLADESDGIGWYNLTGQDDPLPWPTGMESNEPSSTTGASAEIGCLFDPNAAMVYYLGDTWDPGAHGAYGFNGLMSDIRMYNFALSADSLATLYAAVKVDVNAEVKARGPEDLTVGWTPVEGATGYKVSSSTDGTTWTEAGTATTDDQSFMVEGLTEETGYYLMVEPQGVTKALGSNIVQDTTLAGGLVAHFDFDLAVGAAEYVEDAVSSERDSTVEGMVNVIEVSDTITMGTTSYAFSAMKALDFTATDLPPVSSWVRLYNTMMPVCEAWNHRTITFWLKLNEGETQAVPISTGKRAGFAVAIKDGMMHAYTGMRTRMSGSGSGATWWADSTGTEFTETGWVHVAYQFDNPVTRLFINGVEADASDGIGWYNLTGQDDPLPWPGPMEINEPSSTNGVSFEIGALFDPNAAMVQYMGDTWDPGVHAAYALSGALADMRFFNTALTEAEVEAIMMEQLTEVIVSVDDMQASKLTVYPNPAADVLYFTENINAELAVFDNVGKMVLRTSMIDQNQLDISGLAEGMYFLRISTGDATSVVRISVVR